MNKYYMQKNLNPLITSRLQVKMHKMFIFRIS